MIKVLFVLPSLQGGGAEHATVQALNMLDRDKFHPILFLMKKEGVYFNKISKDVEIYYGINNTNKLKFNLFKILFRLFNVARKTDIIVGGIEFFPTYISWFVGFLLGKPVVGWVHTDIMKYPKLRIDTYLFKFIYKRLSTIISVSNNAADVIKEFISGSNEKIRIVYNAIDLQVVKKLSEEKINFKKYKPLIMGVGRLSHEKGFDRLIKAHSILVKQGLEVELIIVGEGPERSNLETLIEKYELSAYVKLVGFQSNPYCWMKQADIILSSSRFEGFSLVLVEAMSLGIPVIATNSGGPAEIIDNNNYGILVENGNIEQMAKMILMLLNDTKMYNYYRERAIIRAKYFSSETIAPKFGEVLIDVMKS